MQVVLGVGALIKDGLAQVLLLTLGVRILFVVQTAVVQGWWCNFLMAYSSGLAVQEMGLPLVLYISSGVVSLF